jgi:hypothetical protein
MNGLKPRLGWEKLAASGLFIGLGLAVTLALAMCPPTIGQQKSTVIIPETSHLAFVQEVVRELAAVEEIRSRGEQELKDDPNSTFANMIHSGTLFKLELGSQVRTLERMRLDHPYDTIIPNLIGFYRAKIQVWQEMSEIGGQFIGGPKPGVDYQKLEAKVPELRARLDYIDQSIFESGPLVFSTLINLKRTNSKGQADHLLVTNDERKDLIDTINTDFGTKVDDKNQNYIVSTAAIIKSYLLKDFKSSDEPWD